MLRLFFKAIPVVRDDLIVGSGEVAEKVPPLLEDCRIAMVKEHGSLAVGQVLEEVFRWIPSREASCRALSLLRLLSPRESQGSEGKW